MEKIKLHSNTNFIKYYDQEHQRVEKLQYDILRDIAKVFLKELIKSDYKLVSIRCGVNNYLQFSNGRFILFIDINRCSHGIYGSLVSAKVYALTYNIGDCRDCRITSIRKFIEEFKKKEKEMIDCLAKYNQNPRKEQKDANKNRLR